MKTKISFENLPVGAFFHWGKGDYETAVFIKTAQEKETILNSACLSGKHAGVLHYFTNEDEVFAISGEIQFVDTLKSLVKPRNAERLR